MTTLVGGRYRLDQRIATGGMGEVWRAADTVLARTVAIKLLKSEYADDPTSRARFEAEAQHAAQLHHPGIAAIFDFGEHTLDTGDTTAYLVMELVDGRPLSTFLRAGEPLAFDATARIIADTADAVQAAHDAGIVHRDIKPANLLVTPTGSVKVTDFGISRAGDGVTLTQAGEVIGTPHYLAPEQAEGKRVTPRSDLYSLGVVLYECLAGRRPFDGSTPVAIALAHVREQPPPLPGHVPPALAAVCRQAIAKDPAQRPESAAAFASAVREASTESGTAVLGAPAVTATSGTGAAPAGDTMTMQGAAARRRRPGWLLPALGVAAVALVVAATVAMASTLTDGGSGTPGPASDEPAQTPSDTGSASETAQESPTPAPSSEAPPPTRADEGGGDERDDEERDGDEPRGNDESGDGDKDGDKPGKGKGRDNGKGRNDDDD